MQQFAPLLRSTTLRKHGPGRRRYSASMPSRFGGRCRSLLTRDQTMVTGTLEHWRKIFSPVGWFIPPYIPMGLLSNACQLIQQKGAAVTQDDLEDILELFYPEHFLAAMVANFYPRAPAIKGYKAIIGEAVEAHFFWIGPHRRGWSCPRGRGGRTATRYFARNNSGQ